MTLSKINSNLQTNQTWRGVVDAGIDQINTNTTAIATNATNIASNDTDIATNVTNIASNLTKINADLLQDNTTITVHAVNDVRVTGHHTVNYTSLQSAISALPKNMSGHTITVQFQDGTYDFGTTQIFILDFTGGIFTIRGNTSNTGSGTYNVILQGQNSSGNGIFSYSRCQKVIIEHIEFQATGSNASNYLIKSTASISVIEDCKFLKTGGTNVRSIFIQDSSSCLISNCNFSALDYAVYAQQNSSVSVVNCNDYGTKPVNGVFAVTGAIVKPMYTVIDSSTSNYGTSSGGLITDSNGLILDKTILTANKTVNFDNSMSIATMQGLINDQPKNLNGHNLTIQFADGTYDFATSQLSFGSFEGGTLILQGDTSEAPNTAGGGLSVIIQSQNTSDSGVFFFSKCTRAVIRSIRFEQTGTNTGTQLIRVFYNTYAKVQNSSFVNVNGTQNNTAVYYNEANGLVENCKFNNLNNNVNAVINSRVCSRNTATFSGSGSDQDATNNIRCEVGSIVTQSGTKAGGADSKNEGVIFNANGTLV